MLKEKWMPGHLPSIYPYLDICEYSVGTMLLVFCRNSPANPRHLRKTDEILIYPKVRCYPVEIRATCRIIREVTTMGFDL